MARGFVGSGDVTSFWNIRSSGTSRPYDPTEFIDEDDDFPQLFKSNGER
jgi:hypothetical protein